MRFHDNEKLRKLAADMIEGKVLLSNQVPKDLVPMVFMPLALADKGTIAKMKEQDVVEIYEYYDQAGSQGINGYPMFFSMRSITAEDWDALQPIHKKMKAAIDLAKAGGA